MGIEIVDHGVVASMMEVTSDLLEEIRMKQTNDTHLIEKASLVVETPDPHFGYTGMVVCDTTIDGACLTIQTYVLAF